MAANVDFLNVAGNWLRGREEFLSRHSPCADQKQQVDQSGSSDSRSAAPLRLSKLDKGQ
jgi:hypothetical protein